MKDEKNSEHAILEAAEEEFLTKGYAAAKTVEIANKAGVTHAMLHYYFRTKENLFSKVYESKVALLKQSIYVFFEDSSVPLLERIESGISAHFDFLRANPKLPLFVINELLSNPERIKLIESTVGQISHNIFEPLQMQIDEASSKGIIAPIKASDLLIDIVSLNLMIFVVYPIARYVVIPQYKSEDAFFEARKKENITVILSRLKTKKDN